MSSHSSIDYSVYVVVPSGSITTRMINKSVNKKLDDIPMLDGKAIIEVPVPVDDVFLDYPLLSKQEVVAWQNEVAAAIEGSVWSKIKRMLGIVSLV